ncbi:MAG: PD-(D/E)XK nuclease family protein [Clostridiales Family XIII bacterium]|jgi:ATP-dependent helicase/nuclease subunit B|nr:PD-(D/E)XK nuclease family protein [Clostridiales Family XIII bacterium]
MLHIYMGRENIDSQRFMYEKVAAEDARALSEGKPKTIRLLVPDQFTLMAERSAFEYLRTSAFTNPVVTSIGRLAEKTLEETGGETDYIDKYGKYMLIASIMKEAGSALGKYERMSDKPPFIEKMSDAIMDLKAHMISPPVLEDAFSMLEKGTALFEKCSALLIVFKKYEEALAAHLPDRIDVQRRFIEKMPQSKKIAGSSAWVYGFDYFSPINCETIAALSSAADDVNVVLTGERADPFFALTGGTADRLAAAAARLGAETEVADIPGSYEYSIVGDESEGHSGRHSGNTKEPSLCATKEPSLCAICATKEPSLCVQSLCAPCAPYEPPLNTRPAEVKHIEKNLYRVAPEAWRGETASLRLVRAGSFRTEAETAASVVSRLIRDPDKGYRYRDITVLCNDLEGRGTLVKRIFERFGLPVFLDRQRDVSHNPLVRFILASMDVRAGGRAAGDVLEWIRTGLTDIGFDAAEELENYAIVYRLKGKAWGKSLFRPARGVSDEAYESVSSSAAYVASCFDKLDAHLSGAGSAARMTDGFLSFLQDDMNLAERTERRAEELRGKGLYEQADEISSITEAALGILTQIKGVFGAQPMKAKEYAELLRVGFAGIKLGILPSASDSISLGNMQRTRTARVRALFVLGANEGELPMYAEDDGLFSESDKDEFERLGLPGLRNGDELLREEQLAIYKNLSKPSDYLFMSCTSTDSAGREQAPSMVFEKMRKLFPDVPLSPGTEPEDIIVTEDSAYSHLAEALRTRAAGFEGVPAIWGDLLRWYLKNRPEKAAVIERGLAFGARADTLTPELLAMMLSRGDDERAETGDIDISPSSIEKYSRCPFSFLMQRGLRLYERRPFEVDSRYMGELYHEALKRFGEEMSSDGIAASSEESRWRSSGHEEILSAMNEAFDEAVSLLEEGELFSEAAERYRVERLRRVAGDVAWSIVQNVAESDTNTMYFEEKFGGSGGEYEKGQGLPAVTIESGDAAVRISGRIDRIDVSEADEARIQDYKSGSDKFSRDDVMEGWQMQLFLYLKAASTKWVPAGVSYFRIYDPMIDVSDPAAYELEGKIEQKLMSEYRSDGIAADKNPEDFAKLSRRVDSILSELAEGLSSGAFPAAPKAKKESTGDKVTACTYCDYSPICGYDPELRD